MRRLYLKRFSATADGTWGVLCSDGGRPLFFTAEIPNTFLRPGVYRCKLQTHFQENGKGYPAYEICDVPGHKDVEIHILNYPSQSRGCVGVGKQAGPNPNDGKWGVWLSTKAHYELLAYLDNAPEFYLEITDPA